MDFATTLMKVSFFSLFIGLIMLNYLDTLLQVNTLRGSCSVLASQLEDIYNTKTSSPLGCDPLSTSCPIGGGFSSGGGQGGGGGSSGAGGPDNWYDGFIDFFNGVYDKLKTVGDFLGNIINQIGSFTNIITILMSTDCKQIADMRILLYIVFTPIIIGVGYIVVRLIKSLIPTIGGD